jgi:FlaA1/EpsC-like NDP-sugar epimerase
MTMEPAREKDAGPQQGPARLAPLLAAQAEWAIRYRAAVKFLLHLGIFLAAYLLAYVIRFEFAIPAAFRPVIVGTLFVMLLGKTVGFAAFDLFRGWWRYVSAKDVLPIVGGCTLGSLLFLCSAILLPGALSVPRSIFLLDWGITLLSVLAVRFFIRTGRETFSARRNMAGRKALIVGAGSAGQMIAREIWENPSLGLSAVGFIDDDPSKIGARIHGLRVLGGHRDIEAVGRAHGVDEIIIAIPSAAPSHLRHIATHCEKLTARFRILPGVGELIGGKVGIRNLRNLALEDLLGRDPVSLDEGLLSRDIVGKVVVVTGAAGSIGSELCRQVARLSPARLVMFDVAETPLFDLDMEMRVKFPGVTCKPAIGDVRDRGRVREIISANRPFVVYHAAAYKHVPVMEDHPTEAVKNNVLGTRVVAEAAAEFGVDRFVLVSTDKAVRPTNVMGATKRIAELIVQDLNSRGGNTRFVAVRFGNVLGSVGSVIPIFRRQLETTGKLTVTHPDATRYFMLIPEAAGLILQAGAMGEGGEVYVLEMGEPVKIVDLAASVIRLSGKELGVNAEIVFTGLRPGEKLHEELVVEGEDVMRTSHPKVLTMIGSRPVSSEWRRHLDALVRCSERADRQGVIQELDALVKGYTPNFEYHGLSFAPESADDGRAGGDSPPKIVH